MSIVIFVLMVAVRMSRDVVSCSKQHRRNVVADVSIYAVILTNLSSSTY